MSRKNKEDNNAYQKKYYKSHPELKTIQANRQRLNYWRKKLIKLLKISMNCSITIEAINDLSEIELKHECEKINSIRVVQR